MKLEQKAGTKHAVDDNAGYFPAFGNNTGWDLYLSAGCLSNSYSVSNLDGKNAYEVPKNIDCDPKHLLLGA